MKGSRGGSVRRVEGKEKLQDSFDLVLHLPNNDTLLRCEVIIKNYTLQFDKTIYLNKTRLPLRDLWM